MNPKRLWATAATIFVLSALGPHSSGVWAQNDTAVCGQGWDWNRNSLGQDACSIASLLDATCRGIATWTIPPINGSQNYVPPQSDRPEDLNCQCNSVVYSLYMECTLCQGASILSWASWASYCVNVSVTQYGHDIPHGTAIPHWAFLNASDLLNQTFNENMAIFVGRDPEATPIQQSTLSLSSTLPTTNTNPPLESGSSPASTPTPTQTNDNDSGGGNNTGAIVGGVVGSIVPLTILAVGVFLYMRQRKQGGGIQPQPRYYSQDVSEYYGGTASPSLTGAALPHSPYYKPGDPTTYPALLSEGQSSLSQLNPLFPNGRGQYRGAAETYK